MGGPEEAKARTPAGEAETGDPGPARAEEEAIIGSLCAWETLAAVLLLPPPLLPPPPPPPPPLLVTDPQCTALHLMTSASSLGCHEGLGQLFPAAAV